MLIAKVASIWASGSSRKLRPLTTPALLIEDVHRAGRGGGLGGDPVDVLSFRDVAAEAARRFRCGREFRDDLVELLAIDVPDADAPAESRQLASHQAPDPARAARDQDVPSRDLAHLTPLPGNLRSARAQPPAAAFTNATVSPSRTGVFMPRL